MDVLSEYSLSAAEGKITEIKGGDLDMQDVQIEILKVLSGPSLAKGDCGANGVPAGDNGCVNATPNSSGGTVTYTKKYDGC